MTEQAASILAVDDRPANFLVLDAILKNLNVNLVKASSGEEAIELAQHEPFAVVLLDVFLPGLDGFETARRIRSLPAAKSTPVIFLTAEEITQQQIEEGYRLGAVDFLIKPLIPIVLRAKVTGYVELFLEKLHSQRQADQLRMLVDGTKDYAIFLLDPDGDIMTWNAGARRFTQYEAHEIIGQHFSRFYPQEALQRNWPQFELETARKNGQFEEEGWRIRKDGSRFWASVVITALYGPKGEIRGFSKVTRDMTERKEAEAALRLAQEDLERRIIERTRQLADANKKLEAEDQRKDEFLAILAHELRNPLAAIRNSVQLLDMPTLGQNDLQELKGILDRQVQVLVRLVDDLLDVSRVMRGKTELHPQSIDLADIVHRAVETVKPLIDSRHHQLTVDLGSEPLNLEADPVRLAQVVVNLLTNAAKYTDSNGRLAITAIKEGQTIVLRISDNGIGIAPEVLPKIFDLFVQADHRTSKAEGGLGIGLTLVKDLVRMHNGTVTASSEGLGRGTTMEVRLPVQAGLKPPATSASPASASDEKPVSHKLLVVDDNRDGAITLATLLRLEGHDVRVAYSGEEALRIIGEYRPSMVFLDLGMPVIDGYELARRIRQRPELADVVLTALTGWGQEQDRLRTTEAGFDYHFTKPMELSVLRELIQDLNRSHSPGG